MVSRMGQEAGTGQSRGQPPKKWRLVMLALSCGIALLISVAISIRNLDGPGGRQRANGASAVGTLRKINKLQSAYAAAHSKEGFACDLGQLKSGGAATNSDQYQEEPFVSGIRAGYQFLLTGCQPDPNGTVLHYQVTAVPRAPGVTGRRAFCTDETDALWYDPDGSAANCLASRRSIH